MASTSRHGGPSWTADELADPDLPAVIIRRAEIGYVDRKEKEEPKSALAVGGDSIRSSEKPAKSNDKPKPPLLKPAPTTANRSKAEQVGSSSAHSTGGSTPSKPAPPSVKDDLDEFDEFE